MLDITNPIFTDENVAREHLESVQWPHGPVCPRCGVMDDRITKLQGKSTRPGVYKCKDCRKPFSVTVGTVFERSKIPLTKWLLATQLLVSSKKGMSAHQLHRMLGVTYKTAWFMAHRIREAMRERTVRQGGMGGDGKVVEADETFIGGKQKNKHKDKRVQRNMTGNWGKEVAFALVERGGKVRSLHTKSVTAATLRPILKAQLDPATKLYTDDAGQYRHMHRDFDHEVVNHSADEYVRGDAHTNTVENYFSILKRGITGVYHHVGEQHLKRYLAEFDFRYNHRSGLGVDDKDRAKAALRGINGKRLTYRRTDDARA